MICGREDSISLAKEKKKGGGGVLHSLTCVLYVRVQQMRTEHYPRHPLTRFSFVSHAAAPPSHRQAIVEALKSGQLAGYAGDVWFPQPAPADHPWRTMYVFCVWLLGPFRLAKRLFRGPIMRADYC